jgi:glycosyltransferase involved in cell wall biosynthesis
MKVFMLGWEFPPLISGGLGTACYGLVKAMSDSGTEIIFVLPKTGDFNRGRGVRMFSTEGYIRTGELSNFKNVRFRAISSTLRPYGHSMNLEDFRREGNKDYTHTWLCDPSNNVQIYGRDIYEQIHRYARKAEEIASLEDFDVIHAHDWMTYPAAVAVARASGKPLVTHVHSTEFDRSGENVNQIIYDIERQGMHTADRVVAVSNYTRNIVTNRYGLSPEKVEVVYNGVENNNGDYSRTASNKPGKIVLFLGRMTMQKGPEYFIAAAKKVLDKINNVKFIMAGDGDMTTRMIEYAAWLGIGHKVFFTRFLRGADVDRAYRLADLYVMPSVSEPFGIAALEALRNDVPVLISKQSGVCEVLKNALKVDFWDINQMANKMAAVLKHAPLGETLRKNSRAETERFRWEDSAARVNKIYERLLACA